MRESAVERASIASMRNHARAQHRPAWHVVPLHRTARPAFARHGACARTRRSELRVPERKSSEEQKHEQGCG